MSDAHKKGLSGATVVAGNTPATPPPAPPAARPPATGQPTAGPGQGQGAGPAPGAPAQVPVAQSGQVAADLVGTILSDRYRIISKLGEGGMGSVYLAEHTTINKRLAIKVLSPEYTHKQDLVDRFLQEARAASMIDQENVVEITDFGSTPGGSVYFVMEYLNGEDLSETIKSIGPMPWERVKPIMLQICTALSAAHRAGIIHRDMKPENCFRLARGGREDFIKVLDFGIAKVTSDEGEGGRALTRTGMIFGTPEYMSPEQAKGERVDHRVDIYATGVILYELLTGRVPFTADTFMGILTKHMFEAPPAPSTVIPTADIPAEVEAIILKALQKDREYRFQSMDEMANAIRSVGTGSAAVSVVQENVAVPTTGKIAYSTHSTGAPAVEDMDDLGVPRSRAGLFIGGAVAAVLLLGGGVWAYGAFVAPDNEETTPDESSVAVVEAPAVEDDPEEVVEDDPEESASGGPEPAVPRSVPITISTPDIDGQVFDGRDDGLLGKTNEALDIPFSTEGMDLYVRAEGYEEQLVRIVPDQEKTYTTKLAELIADKPEPRKKSHKSKSRSRSKSKSSKSKSGSDTKPKKDPEPKSDTPKSDPRPKNGGSKGGGSSPDLKDPFSKKN